MPVLQYFLYKINLKINCAQNMTYEISPNYFSRHFFILKFLYFCSPPLIPQGFLLKILLVENPDRYFFLFFGKVLPRVTRSPGFFIPASFSIMTKLLNLFT